MHLDCLFVNPSVGCRPLSYHLIPNGIFLVCNMLDLEGFDCGILSVGLERKLNKNFDVVREAEISGCKVACVTLHWYHHSYDSIEIARRVKERCDCFVVLGGYTATFFSEEIMRSYPFIDAVVCGESELPMLRLMQEMAKDRPDLSSVPNLVYREDGSPKRSKSRWVGDEVLDKLSHRIDYLTHWKEYLKFSMKASIGVDNVDIPGRIPALYSPYVGRGCPMSCSYCGGGRESAKILLGRTNPHLRDASKVCGEVAEMYERGVNILQLEYDPLPASRKYYANLFRKFREERLDLGVNFGCWGLPDPEFIEDFAATFDADRSCIVVSPESGDERVRSLNKGLTYTNHELEKAVDMMRSRGVNPVVCFSVGLPYEDVRSFNLTLGLAKRLQKKAGVRIGSVPLEPASPMFLEPLKYRIRKLRSEFQDYHRFGMELSRNIPPEHPLGYETDEFSELQIIGMKMKAYRELYLNPSYMLDRISKIKDFSELWKYIRMAFGAVLRIPRAFYSEK